MNSNNCSGQNVSINVNLSLKNETLRMLIEMANDMGASLEDVISSITEDSVIDLERLHDDLGCLLYTSPSPRDPKTSRMPSSA